MPRRNNGPRTKYWCFTINNYTATEVLCLREAGRNGEFDYLIFGREGRTATPHLQGYVEFAQRVRISGIKRIAGFERAHLEKRKGTQAQAAEYCRKEGDFEEYGEISTVTPGQRTDLEEIKKKLGDGASLEAIADDHFSKWVVYRRSFEAYQSMKNPPAMRPNLRVYVLYGEPGTGKSRYVYHRTEGKVYSCPDPTLKWFDGYNGEKHCLIDDYRGDGDASFVLKLLDIYPLKVPVKGSFVAWNPDVIWITSNLPPEAWHPEVTAPLRRRLHYVMKFSAVVDFNDQDVLSRINGFFPVE